MRESEVKIVRLPLVVVMSGVEIVLKKTGQSEYKADRLRSNGVSWRATVLLASYDRA